MCQRVYSHTSGNKPNLSWSWKPAGSGLVHCWMVELFQPKDGNCFLWNLFLDLELIILFLVYEWFACICVLRHMRTWFPWNLEKATTSSGPGGMNGYQPPCRCWWSNLGPLQEQWVLFTAKPSLQLFGAFKQFLPIITCCVPNINSPYFNCSQRWSLSQKSTEHGQQKRWATSGIKATYWITWATVQNIHLWT